MHNASANGFGYHIYDTGVKIQYSIVDETSDWDGTYIENQSVESIEAARLACQAHYENAIYEQLYCD